MLSVMMDISHQMEHVMNVLKNVILVTVQQINVNHVITKEDISMMVMMDMDMLFVHIIQH